MNLGLKLDDQQLRISIGLRLGANICVEHTCHCGKRVERDGLHGLSCTKSAGRFSRHATLNSLIKQTLEVSTCLQCSNHVDSTELMANARTVLPCFLGNWVNSCCGMWGREISSPAIWATKISTQFGDNNVAQMSRQFCALNADAKRSGATCNMALCNVRQGRCRNF